MQELAHVNASMYPIGSTTIFNDFYINDLLSGANTELEAKILRDETRRDNQYIGARRISAKEMDIQLF